MWYKKDTEAFIILPKYWYLLTINSNRAQILFSNLQNNQAISRNVCACFPLSNTECILIVNVDISGNLNKINVLAFVTKLLRNVIFERPVSIEEYDIETDLGEMIMEILDVI